MTLDPKAGVSASRSSAGFTLAELLIVITIIALLIAITIPALGGARVAARKASTAQLISGFTQAAGVFRNDKDRAPGLFTAAEMGDMDNLGEGMSAMENAILDLSGQDAVLGRVLEVGTVPLNAVKVGPIIGDPDKYYVNPDLIASSKDAYFTVSPEYFVSQIRGTQQMASAGHAEAEGEAQLPDVVDAFGQPLLLWVEDEFGPARISQNATPIDLERRKFVNITSDSGDGPARFYWASNAAFLQASELGKQGFDMNTPPGTGAKASIIGDGARMVGVEDLVHSMAALLGNPGFKELKDINGAEYPQASLIPESARGSLIVHSAGPDGIYLSTKDKGMSQAASGDGDHIEYGTNYYTPGGSNTRYVDDKGVPTSLDVIGAFDDIVVSTGG